ncbi:MAG: TetR/AcrR family transcriptional regulator, partial [Gammaproteobacteria bacterium]|nr:TetR/AcrR family transcriptional regulator [Gammaproteobacteria bacterium]NIR94239.1 TetR/AcrR family transcriptional regulator [Gammaproteobacteria bacterium]
KEVHLNGFQSASIQNIIDAAGVTKGALYHYFDSKDAIGLALLDEIFTKYVETNYIEPISNT